MIQQPLAKMGMRPVTVKLVLKALDWDTEKAAQVLGRKPRVVRHWLQHGAPAHIGLALSMILSGKLSARAAENFVTATRTRPFRRAA